LWIVITIVLVAAASGATWWFTRPTDSAAAAATPTAVTRSVAASVQTLKRSISTSGNLTPTVQDDVAFGAGGRVTTVKVTEGDTVKKGQELGTIDTVSLKADLASAKSTLAQARARVAADEDAVDEAADTDSTTDDTTAAAQLAADKATVATALQGVTDAQESLAAATLTSPIDGLVAEVNVAVGDTVAASSSTSTSSSAGGSGSTGTGSTAGGANGGGSGSSSGSSSSSSNSSQFLIVGTHSWKVDVSIDDSQINLVKKGLQAQLTVDGITDPLFGRVTSVGLISTSTGDTASYPVEIAVTGSPAGLHDGSVATIEIIYQQLTGVLTVPSTAVHTESGSSVVYKSVNGSQVSTPVQVGDTVDGYTVITSGLSEGDEVTVTSSTTTGGGQGTGTGTGNRRNGYGGYTGGGSGQYPGGGEFPGGGQLPGGVQVPGGVQGGFSGQGGGR